MKSPRLFLLVSALSAGFAACTTFGSSASDGGIEPSSDAQADTSVTIPSEAGALDASPPDALPPPADGGPRLWKALFVTSAKTTGDLAGPGAGGADSMAFAKADSICNMEAANAGLRGQFLALVRPDRDSNLPERLSSSTGARYLPSPGGIAGPLVVMEIRTLTPATPPVALNRYATGVVIASETSVWTGGNQETGTAFCSPTPTASAVPWTSEAGDSMGTVGNPLSVGAQASAGTAACNSFNALYCVEK